MGDLPQARVVRGGGPSSPPILTTPPRRVPLRLVIQLLVGGKLGAFGWIFAALGMAATCAILPGVTWRTFAYDAKADATIRSVTRTGAQENDRDIYRVDYTFSDARAATYQGTSYTPDPPTGATHPVEYDAADPTESALVGARTNVFPLWTIIVLLFPIAGGYIASRRLRPGWREVRLLRRGLETRGRLVDSRATTISVDDVPLMALTFEYVTQHGATARATVETLTPHVLEDDATEAMLYDPADLGVATTIDQLPGRPVVTAGEIVARPGFSLHLVVAPLATVVFLAWTLVRLVA